MAETTGNTSPTLEKYIHCLSASVTEARAKLDKQTAALARMYLEDDMLRHFSVPRFRIGDISMNVPIAIDSIEGGELEIDVAKTTDEVLQAVCNGFNITAPPAHLTVSLRHAISAKIQHLKDYIQVSQDMTATAEYANLIVEESQDILAGFPVEGDDIDIDALKQTIDTILKKAFLETSPCKVRVIAEASKLKDQSPQSLLNIKINMLEEGMTWAISERKDGDDTVIETKLIPE